MGSEYCPCGFCNGNKSKGYNGKSQSKIYSKIKKPESNPQETNPKDITNKLTILARGNSEPHF